MRVIKDPDERKQEILGAAIRVFAGKGYDKTSISDIAKEIGISQGLCYRYFPSKEAIYDAALEEYASYIVKNNIQMTDMDGLTLKEQIMKMSGNIKKYAETERQQGEYYEMFHRQGNERMHNELFFKVAQKLVPYISDVLNQAKERGEISIENPEASAYFVVYGQVGILMSKEYSEEEKKQKIQQCIFELTGVD